MGPTDDDGEGWLRDAPRVRVTPSVRRVSAFFRASALDGRDVPPREWLAEDLIPSRTVTLLSGDGGVGKSLLALQLAVAVATGGAWIGRAVREGPAMVLSAEDDVDELHRRLDAILRADDLDFAAAGDLTLRSLAGEDALLAALDRKSNMLAPTPLLAELDARLGEERPAVLILDTLADYFGGVENDRAQARAFIGILRGLAIAHGCAVVVLAHPSVAGMASGSGLSGSTAWNASVRSRLYLDRLKDADGFEADAEARVLRTVKSNYARSGGEIALTWRGGVFVADPSETGLDRRAGGAKAARVF
ncbi:MAG: ATPase, partial [Rhodobacteraceae bacterium]